MPASSYRAPSGSAHAIGSEALQLDASPRAETAPEETYYPHFDWLRVVLALTVALEHERVFPWLNTGALAVQVFFALSGWLIGGILLRSKREDLPRFYFQRATRIWIPYFVALAILVGLSLTRDTITPCYAAAVFWSATFVYNVFGPSRIGTYQPQMPLDGTGHHFWSICAEEQFYLLAPAILFFVPRRLGRSIALWVGLVALGLVVQVYAALALGVLAAIAHERFGEWHVRPVARIAIVLTVIITALLLIGGLEFQLVAPWFAIAVTLALATKGKKSKIGAFAGGVSYPFYLNHWIGVFAGHFLLAPLGLRDTVLDHVVAIALSIAVSVVLYVAIDRQVLRRRSRWYTRSTGIALALAGFALVAIGLAIGTLLARPLPT